MNEGCLLSIVTVTKDDLNGCAITLNSTASLRQISGVEQVVVAAGESIPHCDEKSVVDLRQTSTGIAGAFNEGINAAHGEWVWFLNGGDTVHETLKPEWLLSLLASTRAQVVTGMIQFDHETMPRPSPHLSYQWPLIACWLAHPATIVRRDLLLKVGGFDERRRIAMDYDLWFRILGRPTVVDVLSVPFARFDSTGISESPSSRAAARRDEAIVVLKYCPQLVWAGMWLWLRILRRILWAAARRLKLPCT